MAFYNCIDLNIGGGGSGSQPPADPAPQPSSAPSSAPHPPRPRPPPSSAPARPQPSSAPVNGAEWAAGVTYKVGDVVTYEGRRYRCRQGHTTIRSWEPVFTPALWLAL